MKDLVKIQNELKAPKNQYNSFGKYKYRSCEDILEALKPILLKYDSTLLVSDEIKEICGIIYVEASAIFVDSDGNRTEIKAQAGITPDKKGMDLSQSFGSSSSYARKYALNGLFLIDDTKDADNNDNSKSIGTKPLLKKGSQMWDLAVKKLAEGTTTIEKIGASYTLTNEQKTELNNLK